MACSAAGSLLLFLATFAFAVVAMLTRLMKETDEMDFPVWLPDMFLALLMTLSIVTMIGMMGSSRCSTQSEHNDRTMRTWLEVNMKLIGLVLFFVAFIFLEVMGVAAEYSCNDELFAECKKSTLIPSSLSLSIFCHLTKIAWAVTAVSFCQKFRASHFVRSVTTLLGFGLMTSTTLALWADYLITESVDSMHNITNTVQLIENCRGNVTDMHANIVSHENATWFLCLTRHTELYTIVEAFNRYLSPCTIEFLLLFAECIASWFFSSLADADNRTQRPNVDGSANLAAHDHGGTQHGELGQRHDGEHSSVTDDMRQLTDADGQGDTAIRDVIAAAEDDQETLANQAVGELEVHVNEGNDVEWGARDDGAGVNGNGSTGDEVSHSEYTGLLEGGNTGNGNQAPRFSAIVSLLFVISGLPWFAFSALLSVVGSVLYLSASIIAFSVSCEEDRQHYNDIFHCYSIGYCTVLLLLSIACYASTRKYSTMTTTASKPTGFEYFVVLCSFGHMFYHVFFIIAEVETPSTPSYDKSITLSITEGILHLTQVIGQTLFYFYVKIVCDTMRKLPAEKKRTSFRWRKKLLRAVLTSFIISNFALWGQNSFVEMLNKKKLFKGDVFSGEEYIYDIMNPLRLMYRFNSFILFAEVRLTKI